VYSIKTIAKEQTTKFKNGNFVDTKNITQVGQTTIAFQVPDNLNSASEFTGLPSAVQSTGSTALTQTVTVPVTFTFTNASTDAKGFGLRLPGLPDSNEFVIPDSFWYSQQGATVNGATTSSTEVTVDNVGFTTAGMELDGTHIVGEAVAKIYVLSVSGNVITLTAAKSFSDGESILFKAYGPSLIKTIFGCEVEFSNFTAKGTPIQKQVRTSTTFPQSDGNVTLELTGTYGVGGGGHVRLEGFNMNNSGNNNLVTTVTASSTAGSVVINYSGASEAITKANVVPVGTVLNVKGSYQVITVSGNVKVKKYPDTAFKVVLDTTQIITVGTDSE